MKQKDVDAMKRAGAEYRGKVLEGMCNLEMIMDIFISNYFTLFDSERASELRKILISTKLTNLLTKKELLWFIVISHLKF